MRVKLTDKPDYVIYKKRKGYKCPHPGCDLSIKWPANVVRHVKTAHGLVATTTTKKKLPMSVAERVRKYRAKKGIRPVRMTTRKKKQGPRFNEIDAEERGVYGCKSPLVYRAPSTIKGAGYGLFAAVDLKKGDIVTWYSGRRMKTASENEGYTIRLQSGHYLKGITKPKKDHGMGSFINREDRKTMHCKNCCFMEKSYPDHALYVVITKKVSAGRELFTTYSRGYKIPKPKLKVKQVALLPNPTIAA